MAVAMLEYRKLLLKISKDLRDEEFQELKLLCLDLVPAAKAEGLTSGQMLFGALEEASLITPGNVELLKELLEPIRKDLVPLVDEYEKKIPGITAIAEMRTDTPGGHQGQLVTEDVLFKIGRSLARDWRNLARCLKMKNDDILGLASDYRDSLQEQGTQMLFKWFKDFGDARKNDISGTLAMQAAAANTLDEALRKARLSSIADQNFGRVFLDARRK
ncbi:FAS-associated death domain protein-like [Corticium candelabrum]|uniref:FAS-associated death domain protein-like n=1 Tax=Corticium candelabrum TaxID=121492 RepID=UPI002E25DC0B|nr:FAS-associated death domain protein-like [Corticium candelabrum]